MRLPLYLLLPIALLSTQFTFAQGSLDPDDEPKETMRTLLQIEPRIPLETLPEIIDEPGTYFLTKSWDLEEANVASAIVITASDVTVDLGGYSLSSLDGDTISIAAAARNVTIQNGLIRNASSGIDGTGASRVTLRNITVREVGGEGITLGNFATLENCTVHDTSAGVVVGESARVTGLRVRSTGSHGLVAGEKSVVADSTADYCTGSGFKLTASQARNLGARNNSDHGVELTGGTLNGAIVMVNTKHGVNATDAVIQNVTAQTNSEHGVVLTGGSLDGAVLIQNSKNGVNATDALVLNALARNNTLAGFELTRGSARECVAKDNKKGYQFAGSTLESCYAFSNDEQGFYSSQGGQLSACRANENGSSGYEVSNTTLSSCGATSNALNGFMATTSTLEKCTASVNSRSGFVLSSSVASGLLARDNTEVGIETGVRSQVQDSEAITNHKSGIFVDSYCVVRNCASTANGSSPDGGPYAQIFVQGNLNRIEGNHATAMAGNDDFGIQLRDSVLGPPPTAAVTGNIVIGNTAGGHPVGQNFDFPPSGNFTGTVLGAGSGGSSAAHANFEL